jgi:hypothetical protein
VRLHSAYPLKLMNIRDEGIGVTGFLILIVVDLDELLGVMVFVLEYLLYACVSDARIHSPRDCLSYLLDR